MKIKLNRLNYFILGLILGLLLVGGYTTAQAYLTKQKTLGASVVRTGNLDLKITPETGLFDFSNMVPGGSTGEAIIMLENTGTIPLKYRISAKPTTGEDDNTLYQNLRIKIKEYDKDDNLLITHYSTGTKNLNTLSELSIDEHIPAEETRKLGIELVLSSTVGNELADMATNFAFVIDVAQEDGSF